MRYFLVFFDTSKRRVWLSAETKILAFTFGRFRLYLKPLASLEVVGSPRPLACRVAQVRRFEPKTSLGSRFARGGRSDFSTSLSSYDLETIFFETICSRALFWGKVCLLFRKIEILSRDLWPQMTSCVLATFFSKKDVKSVFLIYDLHLFMSSRTYVQ